MLTSPLLQAQRMLVCRSPRLSPVGLRPYPRSGAADGIAVVAQEVCDVSRRIWVEGMAVAKHDESKSSHSMRQACRKGTRTRPRQHTNTHVHKDTNLSEFEESPTILTTAVALVKPVWSCIETRHDQNICLAFLSGVGIATKTETRKARLATCSLRVGGSTPQTSGTFMPISSQSCASLKRRVARKRLNSAMRTSCPLALVPSLLLLMPATPARALSCAGTRLAPTGR